MPNDEGPSINVLHRRNFLQLATATAWPATGLAQPQAAWPRGTDGQRRADLGNGRFLNPVFAGDHPDPTVLKDGDDYYATFSSFDAAPGLTIWHSRDLVNWVPRVSALARPPGTVLAVDLVRHERRYYIYMPVYPSPVSVGLRAATIFVIHAESMDGPWSEPIRMAVEGYIDPGHVVGEDGRRYLFLNKASRVRLSADGLAADGVPEVAFEGWQYPDDWLTEAYALEGPKLFRRDGWFYLISAVGGTAGPPTGHMITVARSRSVHGPWVHAPDTPMVRTRDASERWWSRGHATLLEGPGGQWWALYHGYENGYRTLGRQTLLEPVRWTDDGWPVAEGGDLSASFAKPLPQARPDPGPSLSDDFQTLRLGSLWTLYRPAVQEAKRLRHQSGELAIAAKGSSPEDTSPLTMVVPDQAYEISVDIELRGDAQGGLLLFYSRRLYAGLGFDGKGILTWRGGSRLGFWPEPANTARRLQLRIVNDHHIVTMYYRLPGGEWRRHGLRMEVSGYHVNASDELTSLKPALAAMGSGEVVFRDFRYRARD